MKGNNIRQKRASTECEILVCSTFWEISNRNSLQNLWFKKEMTIFSSYPHQKETTLHWVGTMFGLCTPTRFCSLHVPACLCVLWTNPVANNSLTLWHLSGNGNFYNVSVFTICKQIHIVNGLGNRAE